MFRSSPPRRCVCGQGIYSGPYCAECLARRTGLTAFSLRAQATIEANERAWADFGGQSR